MVVKEKVEMRLKFSSRPVSRFYAPLLRNASVIEVAALEMRLYVIPCAPLRNVIR